jgi:hypothetical protein
VASVATQRLARRIQAAVRLQPLGWASATGDDPPLHMHSSKIMLLIGLCDVTCHFEYTLPWHMPRGIHLISTTTNIHASTRGSAREKRSFEPDPRGHHAVAGATKAPIFRRSSAPQQAFPTPHRTCTPALRLRRPAVNATVVSTSLSCQYRCHVSVRPCPCHARVMSIPRQALSNPGPVMPCNSASPEASPCFLPFPRPSRPFSHLLRLCMHVST